MSKISKIQELFILQFLFCLVFLASVNAQNDASKFDIKTTNGVYSTVELKKTEFKNLSGIQFKDKYFRLLQFYKIPTIEQRRQWENEGLILTDYLSANTYYASIDKRFSVQKLVGFVRSIVAVEGKFKKANALFTKEKSSLNASNNSKVNFIISYYKNLNFSDVKSYLENINVEIVDNREYSSQIDIIFNESALETITDLPFVQFIEPKPEDPVNERFEYRNTTARANYLNTGSGGLNYNGSGVVIAIGEPETLGNQIDLKGRSTDINTGVLGTGHKIPVAIHAASAGNIDPDERYNAWGATVLGTGTSTNYSALYTSHNLRYTNHSFGNTSPSGGYDSGARNHDLRIATTPIHLVSYSSGNSGDAIGIAPYEFSNWANITGAFKQSKNQIAVGALTREDVITSFSSRGPMYDGRIIPQLVIEGEGGTSLASPKVVGLLAILAQVYKEKNAGVEPPSSLLRSIMFNTADDLGNLGPDFIHGYGRPNVRRAYNVINNNQFLTSAVSNGTTNTHNIVIPSNVKQVRVMIVWPDVAATINATTAIVNNLNLSIRDPSLISYNPWILNSTPNVASISAPATRGIDNLNTIEQVTVDNPVSGTWTVNVNGINVPSGPQTYYLVYEFLYDELLIAYPLENEKMTSTEEYFIRWDSYGSNGTFDISYELNNNGLWIPIVTGRSADSRVFKWTAPLVTGGINSIKFRVQRGSLTSVSGINLIGEIPTSLLMNKVCGDIVDLRWAPVLGAASYKIYKLGAKYMEEVSSNITFAGASAKLTGQSTTATEYYAVSAVTGSNESQRTVAIEKAVGDFNCAAISWIGTTSTNWFTASNWSSNTVPTIIDNVEILASAPFQPVIAAASAICAELKINTGATLTMDAATAYVLSVSKDWINNGTFTSGIGTVDFVGTIYQEISGSSTTNFHFLKVTKGSQANVLEVSSVITLNAVTNPLIITSGTFKLSSASTITPFTADPNLNAATGFWNNGGTINSGNFNWTINSGLMRISSGITNIGTASGNSLRYLNNGRLTVEGGSLNITGQLVPSNNSTASCTFNQFGGTITVNKVGSTSTTSAPFEMGVNANFTLSGGTIVIERASSNAADYVNLANANRVTGGTVQIGNSSTPASQTIRINSRTPLFNLNINATNATQARLITNNLVLRNNLTIAGGTFNANNLNVAVGGDWTNNGTFTPGTGTVTFNGLASQTVTGATSFNNLILDNSAGLSLNNITAVNGNLLLRNGILNLGALTHTANTLTLGSSGTVLGSWGNTSSAATNTNNSYFAPTIGILNVASCGNFRSWTGTQNTLWTNSNNWSACGVPINTSDVTINSAPFNPSISSNITVSSLAIAPGAHLSLNSNFDLTVANTISNAGIFTMKNNSKLFQTSNLPNTGIGETNIERNSNELKRLDYSMWSSPVSGSQTLLSFSPLTLSDRFYIYNAATNFYNSTAATNTFTIGSGYLVRMPNEKPGSLGATTPYVLGIESLSYTGKFIGTPNNGNYSIRILGDTYNAVGNPYPSTLNADAFLVGNATDGTIYFWRKTNAAAGTAYAVYTRAGGTGTAAGNGGVGSPNGTIQVGQGFIVKANAGVNTFSFTNAMRTTNTSNQFFRTKKVADKSRIWLNVTNSTGTFSQAMIAYFNGATLGIDTGIDGKYINDSKIALSSIIAGDEYTIQGRPVFDPSDVVALHFKTNVAGDYTITLDSFDGVFATGQDIYLVDALTGTETNLKTGAYQFTSIATVAANRFSLKYQKTLSINASAFNENTVKIFKHKDVFHVNSTGNDIKNIEVYDTQGRLIAKQMNINATATRFTNLKTARQVLIVKVTTADGSIVNKKVLN